MAKIIAEVAGIALYADGVEYNVIQPGDWFHPNQQGFAPLNHVSSMEVSEMRTMEGLIFGIIFIPLLIGIIGLIFWFLRPQTALLIRSEGNEFVTVVLKKSQREDALDVVNKYRALKRRQLAGVINQAA